jgi:hypothetical protein
MHCLRLLLLGVTSIYPLYWTAQFLLFYVPESLLGYWLGQHVQVVGISYLEATAVAQPNAIFPPEWEGLICAIVISALILGLRGDRFLTGALAIVVLSQCALLPFFRTIAVHGPDAAVIAGGMLALTLMVFGLYRILLLTGGLDYLERLALLSLLTVLPDAILWLVLRWAYPFLDGRFLLLLLLPIFLAANLAALLPTRLSGKSSGVAWKEILACSAVACLLIIAISMSSNSRGTLNSETDGGDAPAIVSR